MPVLHRTEILPSPKQLHSCATAASFLVRTSTMTDSVTGLHLSLGCNRFAVSCMLMCSTLLSKAENLASVSPVQLLQVTQCDARSLVMSVLHLSLPPSSSLLLIVSVCLERFPLSTVLMGSFHRGLRLEWIDRRRYPCCGRFANCVWAQCCRSSSYSSSCQDTGKGQLQLRAPSPRPAGEMWRGALRAGFGRGRLHPAATCDLCQDFQSFYISCTMPWR